MIPPALNLLRSGSRASLWSLTTEHLYRVLSAPVSRRGLQAGSPVIKSAWMRGIPAGQYRQATCPIAVWLTGAVASIGTRVSYASAAISPLLPQV